MIFLKKVIDSNSELSIPSSELKLAIKAQLVSTARIDDIKPDFLNIKLSAIVERRVPILLDNHISVAKQRTLGTITLNPDSVSLRGSASIIDSITSVLTEPLTLQSLGESSRRTVNLRCVDKIKYSNVNTMVTIPVEPFTEQSLLIPVKGVNFPDSLVFRPMPSVVKVTFCAPLAMNVAPADFSIHVNYLDSNVIKGETIQLELDARPQRVFNTRITPSKIDYFIEQK